MQTKILKVVYRMDGKYDCELAVIGSNKNLKICLTIGDIDLKPLNDSLQKFLTDHPTVIEQARTLEEIDTEVKDTSYKDEVGGVHDEGCGWNPQGAFCGECGSTTCKNCINQFEEPLHSPEAQQGAVDIGKSNTDTSRYCTCSTPEFEETHPYGWLACKQCGKLKE